MRAQLVGVTKSFCAQVVLDDVTLTIGPSSRLGLVGPNGVGKSMLLRLLGRLEQPEAGSIAWDPATLAVGYLPQERAAQPGETLLAYLARRTGVGGAERELEGRSAALARDEDASDAYAAVLERFLHLGGGDFEPRARAVCGDLGLPVALDRQALGLSGGERARAALAAILLSQFDVFFCWTSRRTTSTSTGSRGSSASSTAWMPLSSSSPTTARFSTER